MTVNHPPFLTTAQRAGDGKLCSHGLAGYCHNDATPAERKAFSTLYGHAYTWARDFQVLASNASEIYAAWYAAAFYGWGVDEAPTHTLELLYQSGVIARPGVK